MIFVGVLLGPVALLLLRSDIMISLFKHGLTKTDSLHETKKRLKDLLAKLIFDWIFGATEQKNLLNKLGISLGAVRKVFYLL